MPGPVHCRQSNGHGSSSSPSQIQMGIQRKQTTSNMETSKADLTATVRCRHVSTPGSPTQMGPPPHPEHKASRTASASLRSICDPNGSNHTRHNVAQQFPVRPLQTPKPAAIQPPMVEHLMPQRPSPCKNQARHSRKHISKTLSEAHQRQSQT